MPFFKHASHCNCLRKIKINLRRYKLFFFASREIITRLKVDRKILATRARHSFQSNFILASRDRYTPMGRESKQDLFNAGLIRKVNSARDKVLRIASVHGRAYVQWRRLWLPEISGFAPITPIRIPNVRRNYLFLSSFYRTILLPARENFKFLTFPSKFDWADTYNARNVLIFNSLKLQQL